MRISDWSSDVCSSDLIDPRLFDAWPREHKRDRAMFEKLKEAYVKARYSKHYRISEEELNWLGERVSVLAGIVETISRERITQLEDTARAAGGWRERRPAPIFSPRCGFPSRSTPRAGGAIRRVHRAGTGP